MKKPEQLQSVEASEKLPKGALHHLLMRDLEADLETLPEPFRSLVQKKLKGDHLDPEDQAVFDEGRKKWWFEKYGFPFAPKATRAEVLIRKYGSREDIEKTVQLQKDFFEATQKGNEAQISEIEKSYEKQYPEELEGIVALKELVPFLDSQRRLSEKGIPHEERIKIFEELTQYQFLLTHFIITHGDDAGFLASFWKAAEKIADERYKKNLYELRMGNLSQVAAFRVLEALGKHPRLSRPKEDAFDAIDLWIEGSAAVQIKGETHKGSGKIWKTEDVGFPAVEFKEERQRLHINVHLFRKLQYFRAKLSRLQELTHEEVRGFLMVIPHNKFDNVTGEPKRAIIDSFRDFFSTGQLQAAA